MIFQDLFASTSSPSPGPQRTPFPLRHRGPRALRHGLTGFATISPRAHLPDLRSRKYRTSSSTYGLRPSHPPTRAPYLARGRSVAEPGGSRAALIRSFAIRISAYYRAREASRFRRIRLRNYIRVKTTLLKGFPRVGVKIFTSHRADNILSVWNSSEGARRRRG